MSAPNRIRFSYKVSGQSGAIFKPEVLQFVECQPDRAPEKQQPASCFSDALTALAVCELVKSQSKDFFSPELSQNFGHYWTSLDISHQLYTRMDSSCSLQKKAVTTEQAKNLSTELERILNLAITAKEEQPVIDITQLTHLVDLVDRFEADFDRPLIFNLNGQLPSDLTYKFQTLYSFMYHLRSLVVLDYNSHLEDKSSDSIRMDRISNYLPNPEYVVNDAILWEGIRSTITSWKPEAVEDYYNQVVTPAKRLAQKWIHNGYFLYSNSPSGWFEELDDNDLQDELYNMQMQWLLGSDLGLLFKIREEAYALSEGYDRIFYPDLTRWNAQTIDGLHMQCEVDESLLAKSAA